MAALEIVSGTTPTYVYNITDSSGSGINLDDYSIGVGIYYEDLVGGNYKYILPANTQAGELTSFYSENPSSETFYRDNRYCRNLGNGKFAVTLPFAINFIGETQYQVFLFKYELGWGMAKITGVETRDEQRKYDAIVIDRGTMTFIDDYMPNLNTERKSGHIILK